MVIRGGGYIDMESDIFIYRNVKMTKMLCPAKTLFIFLYTMFYSLFPKGTSSSRRPHCMSTFVRLYDDLYFLGCCSQP